MLTQHILKNSGGKLRVYFDAAATGTPTVSVVDATGAAVSTGAVSQVSGAEYASTLPPQASLASLTATWMATVSGLQQQIVTRAEIVGGHLFTLAELRSFGAIPPAVSPLASTSNFPDEALEDTRVRVAELFTDYCGVSFVPRYGRVTLDGDSSLSLWLPSREVTRIRSVTVNGTALSSTDLAGLVFYPYGQIDHDTGLTPWDGSAPANVVVEYEHGYAVPPADVAREALVYARYLLTTSQLADRVLSTMTDMGVLRQSVPGPNTPTGILSVDAVLNRYREVPLLV